MSLSKAAIGLIGVGVLAGASLIGNGIQAAQNRKQRHQIEQLHAILNKLNDRLEEDEKEYKALKQWAFSNKLEYQKEKARLKQQIENTKDQITDVKRQIKQAA